MLNGVNPFNKMQGSQGSQGSGKSEESKDKKQEKSQGSDNSTRQTVDHGGGKIMRDFADTMIDMAKDKMENGGQKKGGGFQAMA